MPPFGADDLTVIIPTRTRWPILRQTLDALGAQTVRGFGTVVVVDGDDEVVPDLGAARVVVRAHAGPGAARNAGAQMVTTPLVLFLGDDMLPSASLVERHLARHNRHPDPHVAVLGQVVWHPTLRNDRIAQWLDWSNTQFDYALIDGDEAGFGRFFSCNVSLKRDFFLDGGGFDEDFTYYYEDLDCGWRLNDRGLRLLYEPAALAQHLHRYDWAGIEQRFEGIARGERLMQAKHADFEPWYAQRFRAARAEPRRSRLWPVVVPYLPGRAREVAQRRATTGYLQRLAPRFFNAWAAEQDMEELKAYLGDSFDADRLYGHQHLLEAELRAAPDEATFYRTSQAYLYDLTAFASWGTKVPYVKALKRFVPAGSTVLDYGCGIGSDGLRLMDEGYTVAFADYDNPSTAYLRWRLAHRGIEASVFDVDDGVPGGFDAAISFDVVEHVDDPWAFLDGLEQRAAIVALNLLDHVPTDTHPHKRLPVAAMLDHAAARGLLWYRRYHGRSHLMIYRAAGPGGLRSRLQRRVGGYLTKPDRLTLRR
ncbi:MAG: glycosyltransferase, partial [Acidimicrobiales bacterium]